MKFGYRCDACGLIQFSLMSAFKLTECSSNWRHRRSPACSQEPGKIQNFRACGEGKRIFDVDTQIADGAFDLGIAILTFLNGGNGRVRAAAFPNQQPNCQ